MPRLACAIVCSVPALPALAAILGFASMADAATDESDWHARGSGGSGCVRLIAEGCG